MYENRIAILALQETHLDENKTRQVRECFNKNLEIITSEDPEDPTGRAGVAFVINKTVLNPKEVTTQELHPGRALLLKIKWLEACETSLLNVYVPTNRTEQQPFWEGVEANRNSKRLARPEIVLGDFNVTEDKIDRAPTRLDSKAATEALRQIRLKWEIQDAWRHMHPNDRSFTYRSNTGQHQTKSRLDRIYVARNLQQHTFSWRIEASQVPTDHWLVQMKYAPHDAPHIGKGRWTWPLAILEDPKTIDKVVTRGIQLQNDMSDLKDLNLDRETNNPQMLWETFKDEIKKIAKSQNKKAYHKMTSKIRNLEKDRAALTACPDFDERDDLRTNEAFLASELTHLEKAKAKLNRDTFRAKLTHHGEKPGGIWSKLGKERRPRDLIFRLKTPNVHPPQFERQTKRMAKMTRDYHENLQDEGLDITISQEEHRAKATSFLQHIPGDQTVQERETSPMNWTVRREQVREAILASKNGSATGMDGCPYELWKKLVNEHDERKRKDKPSFDITQIMTEVLQDIQLNGVDERTNFTLGWMCPIYKKKDPTEISNYRPITLLNTDYKLLTKVLALQLMEQAHSLVHIDQAGFIPKRSIFNHIRLAKAIINYAEFAEEDGAIIALDQEKAYDKIRHDYLWITLRAFGLPQPFITTVQALYQHAHTRVAINGVLSEPFKVSRGVRQGDPLSCALFNLAIEPLACRIRGEPEIKGLRVPGLIEKLAIKLFADDTNLYLSREDSLQTVTKILEEWCEISGAKFNKEKTEIIPIGREEHRRNAAASRKLSPRDQTPLPEGTRIAKDGDAVRMLGAWIGNKIEDITPWETVIDKINTKLSRWKRTHPSMNGRKIITQMIVGGHTQFLTQAQGMPKDIEELLSKIIKDFM
jgi:exonuclease III